MRARGARSLIVGIVAALVLVSCGGGGDDENTLSEAEFVSRANAICDGHARAIEEASRSQFGATREVPSADQIESFASRTVVPEVERMVEELEDLKPRERDQGDFRDYLSETRRALDDEIKDDPSSILSEQAQSDPFIEANEQARDLDLNECARVSERIRTAAAARPATGGRTQ